MAKKTRKQKQRTAQRRPASAATVTRPGPAVAPPAAPVADAPAAETAAVTADAAGATVARRRIERVTPGTAARQAARQQQRGSSTAAMFRPLESDDAAIPFDRVPYVPADLRRVGVMAALMVVLIIIAAIIVSHVVT
jgi:hypothetical protein